MTTIIQNAGRLAGTYPTKDAAEQLNHRKAKFRILGTGIVVQQWPLPDTLLTPDDLCIITLASTNQFKTAAHLNDRK